MKLTIVLCAAFVAAGLAAAAEQSAPPSAPATLDGLSFLVGHWWASGAGEPGRSSGELSFEWAADRHALLRHNESISPTGKHTDVMLVYARPDATLHALYTDSEGHAIEYDVSVSSDPQRVVFESQGPGPRFRLWYQARGDGTLATGFEIAQPGSAVFTTYLEGVVHH